MDFAKLLTEWYLTNHRELPWRQTRDPYPIWLSEIILQQTRVSQGLPYYLAFVDAYPTVHDLAAADEQSVLKLWQGLGYYSRARNLHETARYVSATLAGRFPENYRSLIQLKGIGAYTAAAIASFAYGEKVPVVDGNVFRVLARIFDIDTDIVSTSARKEFTELAFELMQDGDPALFNQAVMEFGALQCIPKNPDCPTCIFNGSCLAYARSRADIRPVKSTKAKPRDRFFNYLILADDDDRTVIQKRTAKDIWQNLYEFPLVETDLEMPEDALIPLVAKDYEILSVKALTPAAVIHKLTHQKLHIRFWKIHVKGRIENSIDFEEVARYPLPIVLHNFVEGTQLR